MATACKSSAPSGWIRDAYLQPEAADAAKPKRPELKMYRNAVASRAWYAARSEAKAEGLSQEEIVEAGKAAYAKAAEEFDENAATENLE